MKICFLASAHDLADERVTLKQAVSLARIGHDVSVLGRGSDDPLPREPRLEFHAMIEADQEPTFKSRLKRVLMLPRLYRKALTVRAEVITCHEMESALVGLMLKRRTGARVLFDVHECFEEVIPHRFPRLPRGFTRGGTIRVLRYLSRRCDRLTVVSPVNRDFLSTLNPRVPIDIIHNSPRIELFPLCDQEVTGPLTIVHDGILDETRGMTQMLEAFALARQQADLRLLLVGGVRRHCRAEFEQRVAQLGLAPHIERPAWMPYEELGRVESRAQIGLVTLQPGGNTFRSLNNKLYNYIACGQPVIGPQGSATEVMIRQYDCGLVVDTTRPAAIADAILRLTRDAALRIRLGRNGRRAAEDELGWHRMEERLRDIYSQLEPESRDRHQRVTKA